MPGSNRTGPGRGQSRTPAPLEIKEKDLMKLLRDFFAVEKIRAFRMNSGNVFGSYTSKKTGKASHWRIKLQEPGTPDWLVVKPCQKYAIPFSEKGVSSHYVIWIECKRPKNSTHEEAQKEFQK